MEDFCPFILKYVLLWDFQEGESESVRSDSINWPLGAAQIVLPVLWSDPAIYFIIPAESTKPLLHNRGISMVSRQGGTSSPSVGNGRSI
jgi:hypothetical protein